jgi:hypothetical protein
MIQPKIQEVLTHEQPNDNYVIVHLGESKLYLQKACTFTPEEFETFKREFGKELLEKAADNAKMKVQPSEMEEWEIVPDEITREDVDDEESGCEDFFITINKESITSVLDDYLLNNKI